MSDRKAQGAEAPGHGAGRDSFCAELGSAGTRLLVMYANDLANFSGGVFAESIAFTGQVTDDFVWPAKALACAARPLALGSSAFVIHG